MAHLPGKPDWTGGNIGLAPAAGPGGGGGGGGDTKGELYGDQWVLVRDLDPTDGGGNGEPVLDPYNDEGQVIAIGFGPEYLVRGPEADGYFPIYFRQDAEGDYEIPAILLPYVQEVELERANVARAPEKVMQKALDTALDKVLTADEITTDPAGRIMYSTDGGQTFETIDAPLENLALYQYLMTNPDGSPGSWPEVTENWPPEFQELLGDDPTDPDWDPSALLGAAWAKEGQITMDAMIYENIVLGVNTVEGSGETLQITYFDFSDPSGELYDYDREATYSDTWLRWIEIEDGQPVFKYGTVYDAVFASTQWADEYQTVDPGTQPGPYDDDIVHVDGSLSGLNDFAQAADDSRAVIEFMHTYGAVEIDVSEVPPEYLEAETTANTTRVSLGAVDPVAPGTEEHDEHDDHEPEIVYGTDGKDVIETGGGPQTIHGLGGRDVIRAGGGPDTVDGGNGRDTLYGDGGPDTLIGGNGKDTLIGGHGMDMMTGGNGKDSFVFLGPEDVPGHGPCEEGRRETITDFQPGKDMIDFSAMGIVAGLSAGPEAYHAWLEQDGEDTIVYVDTDGNLGGEHPAEMGIVLLGVEAENMTADDFIF